MARASLVPAGGRVAGAGADRAGRARDVRGARVDRRVSVGAADADLERQALGNAIGFTAGAGTSTRSRRWSVARFVPPGAMIDYFGRMKANAVRDRSIAVGDCSPSRLGRYALAPLGRLRRRGALRDRAIRAASANWVRADTRRALAKLGRPATGARPAAAAPTRGAADRSTRSGSARAAATRTPGRSCSARTRPGRSPAAAPCWRTDPRSGPVGLSPATVATASMCTLSCSGSQ